MTNQQAYEMGCRWVAAGLTPSPGMAVLSVFATGLVWDCGVIIGSNCDKPETSSGYIIRWGELVPDPRDPGNKGHAVAQLRERTGDPLLSTYGRTRIDDHDAPCVIWDVRSDETDCTTDECLTEEDCITAALEATKP